MDGSCFLTFMTYFIDSHQDINFTCILSGVTTCLQSLIYGCKVSADTLVHISARWGYTMSGTSRHFILMLQCQIGLRVSCSRSRLQRSAVGRCTTLALPKLNNGHLLPCHVTGTSRRLQESHDQADRPQQSQ